jgi:Beta-lactamase
VLRPLAGSGVRARSLTPLASYYRNGLLVEVDPGTKWVYSNHGFAALGQIVEDVTGQPLDRYLREHIFGPLGMAHTDLARSERVRSGLASGYVLRSGGLKPVGDYEVPIPGGGGVYSTGADMARYLAALLNMDAHRTVLQPETVQSMFQPHFRPDPRIPGMGLAFEPADEGGYHTVRKGGTLSGFLSAITLAPGQGIGVVVLTNTGGLDNRGVAEPLATGLLRGLLNLPDQAIRTGIPPRPETWHQLCGWYAPDPGPVTNLFFRALFGAGAEIAVRHGHLTMTPLTPVPAMRHGMRLHPDDPDDPLVFRIQNPEYGMTNRVVFRPGSGDGRSTGQLFMDLFSLRKRPEARNPRRWVTGLAIAGTAALTARHRRNTPA